MSEIDLEKLRAVAAAAPKGPWFDTTPESASGWHVVAKDPEGHDSLDESGDGGFEPATAAHIAAFAPPTVLALLDRLAAAEKAVKVCQNAARVLDASKSAVIRELEKPRREERLAVATLDSEREANARLTAEIDELQSRLASAEAERDAAIRDNDRFREAANIEANKASAAEADAIAQARLVGMGAERELALMARVAELEGALKPFADCLRISGQVEFSLLGDDNFRTAARVLSGHGKGEG